MLCPTTRVGGGVGVGRVDAVLDAVFVGVDVRAVLGAVCAEGVSAVLDVGAVLDAD